MGWDARRGGIPSPVTPDLIRGLSISLEVPAFAGMTVEEGVTVGDRYTDFHL